MKKYLVLDPLAGYSHLRVEGEEGSALPPSPPSSPVSLPPILLDSCSEYSDWEADCFRVISERSPDYVDKLYRKDGTHFDQSYHEKLIERHLLLRMQKQLRAQSASDKRQLLQLRQQQRRKALMGHSECDAPVGNNKAKSDTTLHMIRHLQQRAATAGAGGAKESSATQTTASGHRSAGPSVMGYNRSKTATPGSRPNTGTARASAFSRPATAAYTESINTRIDKSDMGSEKPFRPNPVCPPSSPPSTPEFEPPTLDPFESYQILRALYYPPPAEGVGPGLPPSALSCPSITQTTTSGLQKVPCSSPRLASRGVKKRVRIGKETPKPPARNKTTDEDVKNAKLMDPRNPQARLFKQPTKSIPSKCSRYILISHPKSKQQLEPTPLEQQLIEQRFPEWKDRWLAGKLPSPRQQYLSEIIPFKDYEPMPVPH